MRYQAKGVKPLLLTNATNARMTKRATMKLTANPTAISSQPTRVAPAIISSYFVKISSVLQNDNRRPGIFCEHSAFDVRLKILCWGRIRYQFIQAIQCLASNRVQSISTNYNIREHHKAQHDTLQHKTIQQHILQYNT